ncbi:hypothetical protein ACEWY4_027563 [Coilia grayii]|uniref:Centrosomal protein of 89 kDa n=1 Tax=Coilia grayii TaxID=363190 RepID=A0ABD1IPT0_9TELE
MSKFNFSFRRGERKAFKHIAHGLIPAATIAPRPAVPRTPPPRSLSPSPERPRSALAAAILSSSLTGRTVAIPPPRTRSLSESDCSRSEHTHDFQPFATTALYTRDRWSVPVGSRPRCSSPGHSAEEEEGEEEEDEGLEEEEPTGDRHTHVYQSVQDSASSPIYAIPHKLRSSHSEGDELTGESTFDVVSPLHTEGSWCEEGRGRGGEAQEEEEEVGALGGGQVEALRRRCEEQEQEGRSLRRMWEEQEREGRGLRRKCEEQSHLLQERQQRLLALERELSARDTHTGGGQELQSVCAQAQELVDENDALKMTVHRLSAELSQYQSRYRPLNTHQVARTTGLPGKGPPPPWLLDMKYLSPLVLAYEDRLTEKDTLLQACEEEVRSLHVQVQEVVKENEKLHEQMAKMGAVSHKQWRQLQDQACLVLEENRVLLKQLEVQHSRTNETHTHHQQEVAKVCKQLVLREEEVCGLRGALEEARQEIHTLRQQETLTHTQHHTDISQLTQRLEEEQRRWRGEMDELLAKMAALQAERKSLVIDKSQSDATNKGLEAELDLSRHAHRKAQRHVESLKQQLEESMDKELLALQYLSGVVGLAEKTSQQRDQLLHMASTLEKGKQDVIMRIIQGTMQLAKLQEKVKVYRREAASSVCVLGRRLTEQEVAFEGHTHNFLQERRHLQALLRDKQHALDTAMQHKSVDKQHALDTALQHKRDKQHALDTALQHKRDKQHALDTAMQHKREVECELEAVWECVSRESQRCRDAALESGGSALLVAPSNAPSLEWTPPQGSSLDFYS